MQVTETAKIDAKAATHYDNWSQTITMAADVSQLSHAMTKRRKSSDSEESVQKYRQKRKCKAKEHYGDVIRT